MELANRAPRGINSTYPAGHKTLPNTSSIGLDQYLW